MKKSLMLLLAIVTLIVTEIDAQIIRNTGIQSGISISKQSWLYKSTNNKSIKDYRVGLNLVINCEWFDNEYFSVLTDLGYIQKGCKEKIENTTASQPEGDGTFKTYDTRFDYLTFSPKFKIRKEIKNIIPFLFIGPRLDYQLSYKSDFNYSQIENDFKKIIWGLNYGIGFEYKSGYIGIAAILQHQYDFTKIINTESSQQNTGLSIKNNAFVINLGVKYYFKK